MDSETEFFCGLMELQYGQEDVNNLKKIASEISWAKGWPSDIKAFWNAEAFMWKHKVDQEKRKLIVKELSFLDGKNLDLGCGAYSYVKSVGFDISEKMLLLNDNCEEKVVGDLEKELPFSEESFDSVTIVFVLNYVNSYDNLLLEIRRVLKSKGMFVAVLYSKKVNEWQRQKEVNYFNYDKWAEIFRNAGFKVDFVEKEGLWFFRCTNQKIY